jgi:alpha-amylase
LTTRRGNEAQFKAMVHTCHAAGVKVYADVVLNHMQGAGQSGVGSAGSQYWDYNDPGVPYTAADFHAPCAIDDWDKEDQLWHCQLDGLTDLRTESTDVRTKETAYLNHLIALGVDGFRWDAAKHMDPADIQAIEQGLSQQVYIYQEVVAGDAAAQVTPVMYTGNGDVTEFQYESVVGNAFVQGTLSSLNALPSLLLDSNKAQVFIDNHDTERNGTAPLTYKSGALYYLANGFMLAYPFGTPSIVSGYNFTSADQGPPSVHGITANTDCRQGWTCEDRDIRIANMVGFRNATRGTAVTDWWSNGSTQLAFGRGKAGYVVFNAGSTALLMTFHSSLPAGTYCNLMRGNWGSGKCTGSTVTVAANGTFTARVPAQSDLAIDLGARK